MTKELDRAMKRLADMGVTIRTTASPRADSITGRIQAAAERHGIAERTLLDPESHDSGSER